MKLGNTFQLVRVGGARTPLFPAHGSETRQTADFASLAATSVAD
ncbi:hypothetical protein [Chamaesiphon minutus]|nr:hypothetical protein [Chamaesiphon minutus]